MKISNEARRHLRNRHRLISDKEILEAWDNINGPILIDARPQNRGRFGVRRWFISKTAAGRELAIVYEIEPGIGPSLVTAFDEIDASVRKIYEAKKAKQKK